MLTLELLRLQIMEPIVAALIGTQFSRFTGTKAQILTQLRQGAEATPGMIHTSQVALRAQTYLRASICTLVPQLCGTAAQLIQYLYFCDLKKHKSARVPPTYKRTITDSAVLQCIFATRSCIPKMGLYA